MGFVLSILYILTNYLTPPTLFGPLAPFRVELVLAVLIILVSIPSIVGSILTKTVQTFALLGLALATFMSIVVGAHWTGGAVSAFLLFIPNAFAYFVICLHCNSRTKLKVVVAVLVFVCMFVIERGMVELQEGLPTGPAAAEVNDQDTYFFGMNNDAGQWIYRLRGKGEIADPNDFAQLIVCVIPLTFMFWKPRRAFRNFFVVLVPVGILLWGAYLTHSRGSILALLAVVIVAVRRKIGTVPALVLAGLLFMAASALHFAGGRQISTNAGEDRTTLWGDGLQLLKSHPLFGVGFGQMPEYVSQTAHNTIVVCAAELGLLGLYFWSMFLLPSLRDAMTLASPLKVSDGVATSEEPPEIVPLQHRTMAITPEEVDKREINRLGRLMVLSFTGFLVTGWFLSRAFVLTLFLLGGMTEVIFEMALQRGMISPRLPVTRVLRYSGLLTFGLVLTIYVMLRIINITH